MLLRLDRSFLLGLALFGSLVVRVLVLWPKAPLWYDECLTYYATTGPQWRDFVASVETGINATPPVYFALLWLVHPLFGEGFPLTLRLLSAAQLALAGALLFRTISPACGRPSAALGVCVVFGTSLSLLLSSGLDARFYAFFLLAAATVITTSHRLALLESPRFSTLAANSAAHAFLALSCYTGIAFGSTCALALLVHNWRSGHGWRWRVAASAVVGWAALLPLVPLLRTHLASAPTAWIARPRLSELLQAVDPKINFVLLTGIVVLLFLAASRLSLARSDDCVGTPPGENPSIYATSRAFLLAVAIAWLAVPLGFWLLAQFGPNLSLPRYALPMTLGWVVLIALLLHRLALPAAVTLREQLCLLLGVAALLTYAPFDAIVKPARGTPPWPAEIAVFRNSALRDCAIATADSLTYLPRLAAGFESTRLVCVCRHEHEVVVWRRFNPSLRLATAAEFLRDHPRFLLLNDRLDHPEWSRWLEVQLQGDPAWRVTSLAAGSGSLLLLVERR
jgi:MFS family permease